jgi:ABC-type branched-subunit amino acid transport system substrate-binding protein
MTNPQSGIAAADCGVISKGASAWFAHLNSQGGADGHKIDLSVLDDKFVPTQMLANARTFAQNGDAAILGGCGSSPAITSYVAAQGIPYLFPMAPDEYEMAQPVKPNLFVLYPLYNYQYPALIRSAMQQYGKGTAYLVNLEVAGANQAADAITAQVKASGGTMVGNDFVAPTVGDYTSEVLKIKAARPDYLILTLGNSEAAKLVTGLEQQNAMPAKKILTDGTVLSGGFPSAVGSAEAQVLAVSPTPPSDSAQAVPCVAVLKAANLPITDYSIWGCVEAQALSTAVGQIKGQVTQQALLGVLGRWTNQAVSPLLGKITFTSAQHDATPALYEIGLKNGTSVLLQTLTK